MDSSNDEIHNDTEHEQALLEIERLWAAEKGTPDGDRLSYLFDLVVAYEEARWPL
jgi:HTH-type transcriptional regulator/antitoxin HigA